MPMFKSIKEIKKGDTVTLTAIRGGHREVNYEGTAYNDYSEQGNCVSLVMKGTKKMYCLREGKFGLRLTSYKGISLCNVAQDGWFI